MLIYGKNFNNSFENIINVFQIEKNKFFIIIFPSLLPKFEEKPLLELTFSILFISPYIAIIVMLCFVFLFPTFYLYDLLFNLCENNLYA